VKKPLALNVLFIVKDLFAAFVALRMNVKKIAAPSVKLFVLLLNATLLARLLTQNALQFVKNSIALTSASSQLTARDPSVSYNARSPPVSTRQKQPAVNATETTLLLLFSKLTTTHNLLIKVVAPLLLLWKYSTLCTTSLNEARNTAALAHKYNFVELVFILM